MVNSLQSKLTLYAKETEPSGRGNRSLSTEQGDPEGVCQPSLVPYRESLESSGGEEKLL